MRSAETPKPGIPGPNVLVLGAGTSGLAASRWLSRIGRRVTVADQRPESRIAGAAEIRSLGARLRTDGHLPELLTGMALVVTSPGVPPSEKIFAAARPAGIPVWGELELGYRALGEPAGRIVAVSGTKGKSSVVTLLADALKRSGARTVAAGNLGAPLTSFAGEFGPGQFAVVEASSFQLATTSRFRAGVAVLLAVGEDHLDWHPDLAHYRRAKARLFRNQEAADWAVWDGADPVASEIAAAAARESGARPLPFGGAAGAADPEVLIERGAVVRRDGARNTVLAHFSELVFDAPHHRRNLAAAAAAASILGVGRDSIGGAAAHFAGLPHALEEVRTVGGVRFVNDSRATNLSATLAALEALSGEAPAGIRLILGGILKGGRFSDLEGRLRGVSGIHAIGAARKRIASEIGSVPVEECEGLEDAVRRAFAAARPRGLVLLSPGCSSFDLFEDYRDRGRRFRAAAFRLGGAGGEPA